MQKSAAVLRASQPRPAWKSGAASQAHSKNQMIKGPTSHCCPSAQQEVNPSELSLLIVSPCKTVDTDSESETVDDLLPDSLK